MLKIVKHLEQSKSVLNDLQVSKSILESKKVNELIELRDLFDS